MANAWQNALQSLLSNGNLPEGAEPAPEQSSKPRQSGKLIVDIERKGRAGKTATIISGFTLPDEEIKRLATELKSKLGTGGSARGGEILIQGERREAVCNLLRAMGYKV
ncbi:MAG: translation initiation factor [Muribaculaceae bacterium]|nr:translation initiation factor [Muribaculaceae bacterium]